MPEETYLNCAYMAPLLKDVENAGIEAIKKRRNPVSIQPADFFSETESVREAFAHLINGEPSRVVLIPSVSYGMANVVKNMPLSGNQHIILASEQFPSNYYPWKRLADSRGAQITIISSGISGKGRGREWNARILEAINENTGMVAISQVHWADGTLFDLMSIRKRTAEVGAALIIDGTQSVGALPFDVRAINPDALVCAGYKWLMGPYSLGLAYYGSRFDHGVPVEENWINRKNSEDFTGLVRYQDEYQPGALRYEVGEHSNFTLVPMLLAALKQISSWTPERIQQHCHEITREPIEQLRDMGYFIEDDADRGAHLFGIRMPAGVDHQKLKEELNQHRIIVSFRGDAIRISPNVYNSQADLEALVSVLREATVVKHS